jgi:hypothetical protein
MPSGAPDGQAYRLRFPVTATTPERVMLIGSPQARFHTHQAPPTRWASAAAV